MKDSRLLGDGDTVVSLEYERGLRIWSGRTGKPLAPAHSSRIQGYQLLITPDEGVAVFTGFRPWMDVVPLPRNAASGGSDLARSRILAELVAGHALNLSGGPSPESAESGSDEILDKLTTADWLARWKSLVAGRAPRSAADGSGLEFATDPDEPRPDAR